MALSDCNGENVANGSNAFGNNSTMFNLKKDLKMKILNNRQSNGLGDISVDFKPKSPQPMTAAEKEREKRRRECNRKSAVKCRAMVNEERKRNEQLLKEEQARNERLKQTHMDMERQKSVFLHSLTNDYGISHTDISRTLDAITSENKILEAADSATDEDQQSVFYLENAIHADSTSSTSFSSENSEESYQCIDNSMCTSSEGYETVTEDDVMAGNYITYPELETERLSCSPETFEIQVIEATADTSLYDDNDVVTVYVCYDAQGSPAEHSSTSL